MHSNNVIFSSRAIIFLLIIWPACSLANENDPWKFSFTPFVWITGQEGEVATLPPAAPADIDISFSDVVDSLDISLMALLEARKGRVGLFSELFYIGISEDVDTPGPFYSEAEFEQDFFGLTLGASYAFLQNNSSFIDALVGVRLWFLDTDLELEPDLLSATKTSESENWEDYIIGVKGRHKLSEHWYINGWGAIAIAGESDSAWDVMGGIQYLRNRKMHFTLGYRHQEVDYDNSDFLFDVEMSGPILGATFRW